jgi:hypothetical protein
MGNPSDYNEFDGRIADWLERVGVEVAFAGVVNNSITAQEAGDMEKAAFVGAHLAHRIYVHPAEPAEPAPQPEPQPVPVPLSRREKLRKIEKRAYGVLQLTLAMWAGVAADLKDLL